MSDSKWPRSIDPRKGGHFHQNRGGRSMSDCDDVNRNTPENDNIYSQQIARFKNNPSELKASKEEKERISHHQTALTKMKEELEDKGVSLGSSGYIKFSVLFFFSSLFFLFAIAFSQDSLYTLTYIVCASISIILTVFFKQLHFRRRQDILDNLASKIEEKVKEKSKKVTEESFRLKHARRKQRLMKQKINSDRRILLSVSGVFLLVLLIAFNISYDLFYPLLVISILAFPFTVLVLCRLLDRRKMRAVKNTRLGKLDMLDSSKSNPDDVISSTSRSQNNG